MLLVTAAAASALKALSNTPAHSLLLLCLSIHFYLNCEYKTKNKIENKHQMGKQFEFMYLFFSVHITIERRMNKIEKEFNVFYVYIFFFS